MTPYVPAFIPAFRYRIWLSGKPLARDLANLAQAYLNVRKANRIYEVTLANYERNFDTLAARLLELEDFDPVLAELYAVVSVYRLNAELTNFPVLESQRERLDDALKDASDKWPYLRHVYASSGELDVETWKKVQAGEDV